MSAGLQTAQLGMKNIKNSLLSSVENSEITVKKITHHGHV